MSTPGDKGDEPPHGDPGRQELEEKLRELGLDTQYWVPKLQEYLGVTSAQALQHLQQKEILTLKSQAKHPWEKRALEKVLQPSSGQGSEKMQENHWVTVKERQVWAQSALKELREMQAAGKSRQEVIVREKEEELRQAMEIPHKYWPLPEKPLTEVIENMKRHLSLIEGTLSHRENLPDRELLKRISGGLALQGIYQTNHPEDLLGKREELLSLPENFFLLSPAQGTRMETMEFLSSHEESMFTESMEKLGFSVSFLAKGGGWGFKLEASTNYTKSSDSREVHKSRSEHTYSCTTKFCYIPLASCHFSLDQLHLSRSALQELKQLEQLLSHSNGAETNLKHRCEAFFQRFGSHVNQGPLHLGGVFWWKAVAEGFRSEELNDVKRQASEALDVYVGGSYSGFGVTAAATFSASNSQSQTASRNTSSTNLQARFQMSVYQTGGPPEVDSLPQWKAGLVASNHTWCVIDRGYQLVPVWDIILSNHRQDFQDPLQVTRCLTDLYTALTGRCARIQDGEELLSAVDDARSFVEEVKSWDITEPEEKLMKLMDFKQNLSEQNRNSNMWINICLKNLSLQQFLVDIVNFCKDLPVHETKFIKSQLRSLLYPHVYQVEDFPQSHSIMQWVFYSAKEQQDIHVTEFADFIQLLEKAKNDLLEINHNPEYLGKMEEAQRKVTYKIGLSLSCFLKTLKQAEALGTYLLLLSIAAGAGYKEENQTFHCLLGCEELNFLLCEMKEAHEKYQNLNKECGYRAQAFLLFTGLTITPGPIAVSAEEKMQRLNLIQSHMGQSWTKEVLHVLKKPRAGHDWETLEKDLNFLISGEYEATVNYIQMDQVKKELDSVSQRRKKTYEREPNTITHQEVIKNSNFLELAKRLGLEHYYPRRMGREDFHLIYKTSVHDSQPETDKQLPFYFLQKLLMLDYRLRYLVCKGDGDTMGSGKPTLTNLEDDTLDPYDDFFDDRITTPHLLSKGPPHIHPMDTQMVIFHCADDFMRQYISNKLSICQFAVPIVVPNPCTSAIEFPLWSLSQIKKSWRQVEKSSGEDTVINFNNQLISQAPIPIVSFIRVVNSASSSKSQILNSLLSKHKHDAFFHRHCRGSSKFCLLMGGMVEISWFCPGGRDEDRFERCVAFTNLRGDAKDYETQLRFLQEIASVTVVLVSTSDKSERTVQMVRDLWKSTKPLIYLFDDKDKTGGNDSGQKVRIGIRNRNEAELMDELTNVINRLLRTSGPFLSLEDCAEVARCHGFLVDVDRKECQEAKGKAQALLVLMKEMKLSEMKERLLPLQGELWHQWCKKDKELCHLREKGNRSLEQHKSEIETDKQIIRQKQLKRAFPLNDLMRSVLEILQSHSEKDNSTELYFLQWLSTFMDNLTRGHLENLQKRYRQLWSLVLSENQKGSKSDSLKCHQVELEAVSKEIRDSSLGIEHLLREVGQIYEALEEASSQMDTVFFSLPQIAADLMVSGYPLELMDGDASYVPLKWVAAVFDRLSEKIGDQKLFVLSVLGLQSTGKSTLLNAMFGLQFNVSAGRCTRGAYMQLLKVEETLWEELGFGFVLVIDTEGLRAPELNAKSQNRDNELATFVIGLGNLTLINIFGENPSEMQDILQIAVQAFLRMKQVNISPSCLFVHQNVGEITAKDQNMEGRRRLQQRLDEMAATAAEQEEYSGITCFSDVIRFDVSTHVHYFAHLWEGDPPMAPPNPTYSHNIQELKRRILLVAKKESKGSILKMSEVKVRIHDLWKALVNENFIFSFRNTREIMAMIKLETMYNNWTWNLRSHVLDLQNQLTNQIQNGEIQDLRRSVIEANIAKKYEDIKKELQKYFDEDQENEILIQWKGNFENKLANLKEALVSESIRKSNDLLSSRKSQDKLDQKKSEYEKELLLRSRDVALSLMGKELSEEELRERFSLLWTKWVCEVSSNSPPAEDPNIDVDLENVFLDYFKQEHNVVSKLRDHSRRKKFSINYEKHVKMKAKLMVFRHSIAESDKRTIMQTTEDIFSLVTENIESKLRMGKDYNISYFHEILRLIDKNSDSISDEVRYTFTNEYKIDLSLCLCHRAAAQFRDMHTAFKRAHDPVTYLENKREDFFMSFKISCQGATSITAFADFLWSKISASLPIAIWKKIALDLAGEIRANCPAFNGNRSNLEKYILISLAKEENFENYWEYIHTPKQFFKNYIEKEIQAYCISRGNEKLKNFLSNSLEFFKKIILSAIHESTLVAKDQNNSASIWLDTLCNHLGRHLTLPRGDLRSIEHQEIADIEFLKEAMNENLDIRIQRVGEACEITSIEKVVPEIQAMLSDQLSGCWNQCPFCKAICTNTAKNHSEEHSVPFHRSQAVRGWKWYETEKFALDFCTSSVASDLLFVLKDGRCFPYKTYRQAGGEYATWNITPDTSAQPYWKWFICRFRSQLEERYNLRFQGRGQIPNAWFSITKQDVLNDLNK
ncbi:interferon-induced very large GTPase 1-like [Trichosurus vulpecula]|uniref:interferon-induced very large GTPase 1-like n=1 Tax=Trichosurus vulpecula TaxID=9337 RepID=UPI00186ABDA8|nr:interferon-induced very large GTPase 1-like [Trichosurus vulpecula]